jgi:hypothetical protein
MKNDTAKDDRCLTYDPVLTVPSEVQSIVPEEKTALTYPTEPSRPAVPPAPTKLTCWQDDLEGSGIIDALREELVTLGRTWGLGPDEIIGEVPSDEPIGYEERV